MHFFRRNLIFSALILAFAGTLASCAANSDYLQPTQALLSTDKSTSQIFEDLRASLAKFKYKIALEDKSVGLLISEPRQFSYVHNGQKIEAQQTVQIRQEGGAVKIRLSYSCDYSGDLHFVPCKASDADASQKAAHLSRGLIALVTRVLQDSSIH